ncbi:MAG: hypothetical protein ACD_78C00334G0002 [uncultured bacterium (gcode 4)]|uniref:Uncharacterized protein n=1 Tax=uncultured bacterium (gcode 4) TaxID=1234023 RepID=K1YWI6_9BACT|nr:MAG: hypothetical protein ACD_78C00334G0002 [uncultured bacterium (gcode 4)]
MIYYVDNIEKKTFLMVIGEMFRDYPEIVNMYSEIIKINSTLEEENRNDFFDSIKSFFSSIKNMNIYLKEGGNEYEEKKFVQEIKNQYNHFVQNEQIYKNKIQEIQEKNENLEVWDVF